VGDPHLAGRAALLEAIMANLADGGRHGVLLAGAMGSGKTSVAAEAVRREAEPRRVLRLAGSPSLARAPFAVLAPYLPDVRAGEAVSAAFVLRSLQRHCDALAGAARTRPLVVVDDAHQVDEGSLSVLAQLVAGGTVRVLFASLPRTAIPAEVLELWTDGFLERFDLAPLLPDEVHEACAGVLGGTVLPAVGTVLGRISEGNPLYLHALLASGLQEGRIVRRNGVWMFDGGLPSAGAQSLELVKCELRQRSPAEREALETIALAEPVPLGILVEAGLAADIDALETADFVRVGPGPGYPVTVSHPLLRDAIRQLTAGPRNARLRRRIAPFLDRCPPSAPRLVRQVVWSLDCGETVPPAQLVEAAAAAVGLFDVDSALRAAAAVSAPDYVDAAKLQAARARCLAGELRIAADLLEELLDHSAELPVLFDAAVLASRIASGRGHGRDHIRIWHAWKRVEARYARSPEGRGDRRQLRPFAEMAKVLEAQTLLLEGRYLEAEDRLRSVESDFSVGAEVSAGSDGSTEAGFSVVNLARGLLGEVLAATGRTETAVAFTAQSLTAQTSSGSAGPEHDHLLFGHLVCLLLAGRWEKAGSLIEEYRNRAGANLVFYGGSADLLEGIIRVCRGCAHSGLAILGPAVESLRGADPENLLPLGLGFAAFAAAVVGDRDSAERCADEFTRLRSRGASQLHLIGEAHVLAARAALGDAAAVNALGALARQARALAAHTPERIILTLLVRDGQRGWLPRLADLAADLEGTEAQLLHAYAAELASQRPGGLSALADRAAGEGFPLLAVECLAHAVQRLGAAGDRAGAASALARLRELRSGIETPADAVSRAIDGSMELTAREREIVGLARLGQSNREIARTLSLSTRTVEGHIYRIFAKLGISSREELRSAPLPAPLPPAGRQPDQPAS
jgi:DNA-binding CsgD family transcriptional regulator